MLKKLIIAVAGIVVVIVAAAFVVPLFIPTETVRAGLVQRIEQATGRTARIDGPISISLLPTVHVSAGSIGLAGLTGGEDFTVDAVSFGVELMPLLSGKVALNAITIERPVFVYAIDADGKSNWASADAAPAEATAETGWVGNAEYWGAAMDHFVRLLDEERSTLCAPRVQSYVRSQNRMWRLPLIAMEDLFSAFHASWQRQHGADHRRAA